MISTIKSINPFVGFLIRKYERLHLLFSIFQFLSVFIDINACIRALFHCGPFNLKFRPIMDVLLIEVFNNFIRGTTIRKIQLGCKLVTYKIMNGGYYE